MRTLRNYNPGEHTMLNAKPDSLLAWLALAGFIALVLYLAVQDTSLVGPL